MDRIEEDPKIGQRRQMDTGMPLADPNSYKGSR